MLNIIWPLTLNQILNVLGQPEAQELRERVRNQAELFLRGQTLLQEALSESGSQLS